MLLLEQLFLKFWKPLFVIGAGLFLFCFGYYSGYRGENDKFQKYQLDEQARAIAMAKTAEVVSAKAENQARSDTEKVRTVYKEITKYVTVPASVNHALPNGFVSVWNSASSLQVPNTTGEFDATNSTVTLSDALRQHTEDARQYYEVKAQCEGLQQWVKDMAK